MIRFRVLMMIAGLLAAASAVHAQMPEIPSNAEIQRLQAEADRAAAAGGPLSAAWFAQALEHGAAVWQRLSATKQGDAAACAKSCEGASVKPGEVKGSGVVQDSCCKDAAVRVQQTHPAVQVFQEWVPGTMPGANPGRLAYGYKVVQAQAQAPCCCAKACACCESCKAKSAGVQVMPLPVPTQPVARPAGLIPRAPSAVALPRFETPDLEVHCEKMSHRGDTMVFEGKVMLLNKKHVQPVRIEAHCVVLNLKDGSFTVEAHGPATSTTSFGVLRMTIADCPATCVPIPVLETVPRVDPTQRPGYVVPPLPVMPTGEIRVKSPPVRVIQTYPLAPNAPTVYPIAPVPAPPPVAAPPYVPQ
jgi:hypothetical protein